MHVVSIHVSATTDLGCVARARVSAVTFTQLAGNGVDGCATEALRGILDCRNVIPPVSALIGTLFRRVLRNIELRSTGDVVSMMFSIVPSALGFLLESARRRLVSVATQVSRGGIVIHRRIDASTDEAGILRTSQSSHAAHCGYHSERSHLGGVLIRWLLENLINPHSTCDLYKADHEDCNGIAIYPVRRGVNRAPCRKAIVSSRMFHKSREGCRIGNP